MDIVTDLTAEAVSYLTLFQDILKSKPANNLSQKLVNKKDWVELTIDDILVEDLRLSQRNRIKDLIWHSPTVADFNNLSERYFTKILHLLQWLSINVRTRDSTLQWTSLLGYKDKNTDLVLFRPPFFWRERIRAVLYTQPEERIVLVERLRYMPLQVILALADKDNKTYHIRLYQLYEGPLHTTGVPDHKDILSSADRDTYKTWWNGKEEQAKRYLTNDYKLLCALKGKNFPLPFETLFRDELIEISKARKAREKEWSITFAGKDDNTREQRTSYAHKEEVFDPLIKARDMKLMGIALSGGGIRSATFNLGILQRLASLNVLHQFDYMSTVSGGGYIGTWLTSWIKRSGSFCKINDRLSPDKSGDPLADEVRPIRWLRMFSNYLSPNVGIMSTDAWTTGITWLRNTVINQVVLLLSLLTVLSLISDIYVGWKASKDHMTALSPLQILLYTMVMLIPGSLLIAVAMRSFCKIDKESTDAHCPQIWERLKLSLSYMTKVTAFTPHLLVLWGSLCALLISMYFVATGRPPSDIKTGMWIFLIIAISALAAFLWLALRGNYHIRQDPMQNDSEIATKTLENNTHKSCKPTILAIILSSIVASAAFAFLLGIYWMNINTIYDFVNLHTIIDPEKIIAVTGVPIILEIFSIAVIIRMALMGNLFPDYRREWWGRLGGYIHRFILFWIIVSFASLIMHDLWKYYFKRLDTMDILTTLGIMGGWSGVVGWGVKKAFESKEETSKKTKNPTAKIIKIVPFIFMIGVLLIGSWINEKIRFPDNGLTPIYSGKWHWCNNLLLTLVLAGITLLLSWRIGVNEFSLHHFYRNRLIRAFLGATRSRADRIKTANAFTGFDTNDDILLSSICVENGYFGPFPLINAALNATVVSALDRQDRKAESFIFSPLYCGYDFSPTRSSTYNIDHTYEYGYRPTAEFSNKNGGPTLGTAMAISGAAVNPNSGHHSSAPLAFLLTLFNLRLGWWIGNPRRKKWRNPNPTFGLLYLIRDLIGKSDINMNFVCLSDGGHFDNMGLYELVRRRCHYILLGDGEQDEDAACEGLANAIRRCRIDFGVEIDIDITAIAKKDKESKHIVKGDIIYPGESQKKGTLIYIKTTLTGDESVDIREYALANPDFPQQSTGDQFFDEAQFESYRKLGYHSIRKIDELHLP
ncbi:Patatin-like phospholipase [Chitinophaga sp. CF118]|uniref:patatin-like phospholipase family protein n=1 Tax=Chitinophaga sp. CF118 TaxID=1884367 RepID=UPI0008F2A64F|nr:patatin-like phospholipase family protein [Chitinophaga sp. CF118]SFF08456.1 Patatin-like phospholipase [Chitinophaga sp. CF118]